MVLFRFAASHAVVERDFASSVRCSQRYGTLADMCCSLFHSVRCVKVGANPVASRVLWSCMVTFGCEKDGDVWAVLLLGAIFSVVVKGELEPCVPCTQKEGVFPRHMSCVICCKSSFV